jgi:hypothetical protein
MNSTVSQAGPEGVAIPYALQEELLGYYQTPFWGMSTSLPKRLNRGVLLTLEVLSFDQYYRLIRIVQVNALDVVDIAPNASDFWCSLASLVLSSRRATPTPWQIMTSGL